MGTWVNTTYGDICDAALEAETILAEKGYFCLTDNPDDENFRQEVIGWKKVEILAWKKVEVLDWKKVEVLLGWREGIVEGCFPNREVLKFPVTAQGVYLDNHFIEQPDGSVAMGGYRPRTIEFFSNSRFENLEGYKSFCEYQKSLPNEWDI